MLGSGLHKEGGICSYKAQDLFEPVLLPTQSSHTSTEEDEISFRSRTQSCTTENASDDALSIRSEMIQRKGTSHGRGGSFGEGEPSQQSALARVKHKIQPRRVSWGLGGLRTAG